MIYATGTPLTYTAVASTQGQPSDTFTYAWVFDDNTVATGSSYAKTWATIGNHISNVTATDTVTGGTATASKVVTVAGGSASSTSLNTGRAKHASILLNNGKVLITGGCSVLTSNSTLSSCEIYDPVTGLFTPTGSMNTPRMSHKLALLPNGDVLAVGGCSLYQSIIGYYSQNVGALTSCEIYSVASGTWTPTGSTATARLLHTLDVLANGNVIVTGGVVYPSLISTTEIFNPSIGTWSAGPSLPYGLAEAASLVETDGTLWLMGGTSSNGTYNGTGVLNYNGSTFTQKATYPFQSQNSTGKSGGAILQLGNSIILVGGHDNGWNYYQTDIGTYSILNDTWSQNDTYGRVLANSWFSAYPAKSANIILTPVPGNLITAYGGSYALSLSNVAKTSIDSTATYLGNGYVLVCGGADNLSYQTSIKDAYLYFIGA